MGAPAPGPTPKRVGSFFAELMALVLQHTSYSASTAIFYDEKLILTPFPLSGSIHGQRQMEDGCSSYEPFAAVSSTVPPLLKVTNFDRHSFPFGATYGSFIGVICCRVCLAVSLLFCCRACTSLALATHISDIAGPTLVGITHHMTGPNVPLAEYFWHGRCINGMQGSVFLHHFMAVFLPVSVPERKTGVIPIASPMSEALAFKNDISAPSGCDNPRGYKYSV
jgi:hypothetical protein